MLILASSSVSRSNLLKEAKIEFQQISFDYDENLDKNLSLYLCAKNRLRERKTILHDL